jgi:hypothetical protein
MGGAEYSVYVIKLVGGVFICVWAGWGIFYLAEDEGSVVSRYVTRQHNAFEKERAIINLMVRGPLCWVFLLYIMIFKWVPWSKVWDFIYHRITRTRV